MRLRLLLPFKGTEQTKSRWGLSPSESRYWALELLDRSVAAARGALGAEALLLVTSDIEVAHRYPEVDAVVTSGAGLNEDLESARRQLLQRVAVERVGVLLPDLPEVSVEELSVWWEKARGCQLLVCPDRDGAGTNSVCMSPGDALPFLFEGRSAQRFLSRAGSLGLTTEVLTLPGLADDCDSPTDLMRWAHR